MTYEGWANYHTWNVALWIKNDENLYKAAVKYVRKADTPTYVEFLIKGMPAEYGDLTGDCVSWTDPTLDIEELDTLIREMRED